jgi:hypothetical protein
MDPVNSAGNDSLVAGIPAETQSSTFNLQDAHTRTELHDVRLICHKPLMLLNLEELMSRKREAGNFTSHFSGKQRFALHTSTPYMLQSICSGIKLYRPDRKKMFTFCAFDAIIS